MPARRSKGEGTIWHEKERGRYVGRLVVNGRTRKVTGRTRSEVATKLRKLEIPADGTIRLGELIDRALAREVGRIEHRGGKATTLEHRRHMLAHFHGLSRRPLTSLRSSEVDGVLDEMARTGYARSTIERARIELGRVLEWARNEGLVTRNVAKASEMPAKIAPKDGPRSLTRDELARLQTVAVGSKIEHLLPVAIGLCLRPGELLGLRWRDIDFKTEAVHIEHALMEDGSLGEPKTPRSKAKLKAGPSVMAALTAQRTAQTQLRQRRLAAGQPWTNLDFVFPTRSGTPMDRRNLGAQITHLCRKAGVAPITPNELRHTGASLLIDQGEDYTSISRQLRHTSTRMLEIHYGHEIAPLIDIGAEDVLAANPSVPKKG